MKMKTNYIIGFTGMGLVMVGALLKIKQYTMFGEILMVLGLLAEAYVIYRFFSGASKKQN